ncbi:MAG: hypothetical protein LAO78_23375 [Acidobacteriia bacterium]|nr:hypothetical protein [Terriglobia bacterium]
MAATGTGFTKATENERPGGVFTWTATVLACAYIVWMGASLYLSTPIFINMFNSMGVELPLSTRIVIAAYRFLYPLLFGGALAVVIAKQFYVRQKWVSLSITLGAVVVTVVISNGNRQSALPSYAGYDREAQ